MTYYGSGACLFTLPTYRESTYRGGSWDNQPAESLPKERQGSEEVAPESHACGHSEDEAHNSVHCRRETRSSLGLQEVCASAKREERLENIHQHSFEKLLRFCDGSGALTCFPLFDLIDSFEIKRVSCALWGLKHKCNCAITC